MKKIGFLLDTFPSVTEHFVHNELVEFKRVGIEFSVFALKKDDNLNTLDEIEEVYYIKILNTFLLWIGFIVKPRYIKFLFSELSRQTSFRNILRFVKRLNLCLSLNKILKEQNIDHIHSHFAYITTEIALLTKHLFGISYSFTCHAKDIYVNDIQKLNQFIEQSNFVVTCTKYNKTYLNKISNNKFEHKIHHVYHGLDLNKIESNIKSNKKDIPNVFKIICVARLVEKKGIIYLLKAIELVLDQDVAVACEIIGDGELYKDFMRYVKTSKSITNEVTFLKAIPHKEVLQKISDSDAFVLPCIIAENGDRDGLPNTILEAMYLKVPVVTTPVSAIREVVNDGQNGVLVPPKNEREIANAVSKLIHDRVYYNKIVENAHESVSNHLDISLSTKALVSILETN